MEHLVAGREGGRREGGRGEIVGGREGGKEEEERNTCKEVAKERERSGG